MTEFQLIGYLRRLAEFDVDYLIVGGVGSRIQGAPVTTQDLDIVPNPDPDNLDRLALTLSMPTTRKKSTGKTSYDAHPFVDAMEFKTSSTSSYQTAYGIIDVLMELPGVGNYDKIRRNARKYDFDGVRLNIASLEDIITSKKTADRAKDWQAMDALEIALRYQLDQVDGFELSSNQLDTSSAEEPDQP